ncbi:hypothetical protein T4E_799 [Trichinella pseudospiralis]|uniref:Uncharacterized protein n=1 Tax=Trichinella pseudospiralis TaxID=6337 RepID=A0A0V0Y2L0_TRIPS|nr:hypothetical protein T4E_799 [Trichinella pseudospiralis]
MEAVVMLWPHFYGLQKDSVRKENAIIGEQVPKEVVIRGKAVAVSKQSELDLIENKHDAESCAAPNRDATGGEGELCEVQVSLSSLQVANSKLLTESAPEDDDS